MNRPIQQRGPKGRKKPEVYKVVWLGKSPSDYYEKPFKDQASALAFSKKVVDSLVFKRIAGNPKDRSSKWKMVGTGEAKEFIKGVNLKRKLTQKGENYAKIDGNSKFSITTTGEYQKTQISRIGNVLVAGPLMIWAGTHKELPEVVRLALFTLGGVTIATNGHKFFVNRKLHKK